MKAWRIQKVVQQHFRYRMYAVPKNMRERMMLRLRGYRNIRADSLSWRKDDLWSHPRYRVCK